MKQRLHKKVKRLLSAFLAVIMLAFVAVPMLGFSDSLALTVYKPTAGDYMIFANATTFAISVKGASTANSANVQLAKGENVNAQHMVLVKSGDWYFIKNKWSGKVLSVANGKKASGVNVWQYQNNNANSQKWKFYSAGNNKYYIKNALGYYLTANSIAAGSNINVKTLTKSNNQKWTLTKKSDPSTKMTYSNIQIFSVLDKTMLIDLSAGNLEPGAKIQLYTNQNKTSQKFRVKAIGNGYYYLQNGCSNKYLEVKNGSTASGADATQWTGRGGEKQQMWRFIPCGNGYYYIQSALGKYLTIDGHTATLKAVIQLEGCQSINAQKWIVKSTSLGTDTYINRAKKFIADDRWKDGAAYGNRKPYLNAGADWWGCGAYCVDWAKYMYGKASPRDSGVTKYTKVADIRNGDVIHVNDSHGTHWFIVLSRNGNWLKTAEGNVDPTGKGKWVARVSTSAYRIQNGKIYSTLTGDYRVVTEAFHFADHMKFDK